MSPEEPRVERRRGMDEVNGELAAIRSALEGFATAADQIVPRDEFQRSRRELYTVGGAVAFIVIVLGFLNLLTLQDTDDVLERLVDCTTPTGECYQQLTGDGSEQQKELIAQLEGIRCLVVAQGRDDPIAPCLRQGGGQ